MTGGFLALVLLLVACGPAGAQAPEAADEADDRPNIVFVLVDDLRWDELGIAGHPYVETPSIDRVAREGAWFQRAFTTTPLCSPARATFLTGLYPHSNGITDNTARDEQSHRLETFPKRLHAAGYDTAFIGKWHMGNDDSPRPGFATWVAMKGQGEALRIPLMIRYPSRIVAGRRPEQLVLSLDLAPTLLELAGEPVPDALHGRSLAPILAGGDPEWRTSFLVEYWSDTVFQRMDHMGYKAVRTDRYKYIRYEDLDDMDELYDLAADPYELRNVIAEPRYADVLAGLQAELSRLLAETS